MSRATTESRWSPTKPRAPIGAHFSSPGPKYSIPGSIGFERHDLRKVRGPAYSFGSRHSTFSPDCSPGPAYMVPSRVTKFGIDGTPKYSLHGRPRDLRSFKNPGPGTYSPEKSGKSAFFSPPSYSLSGRSKLASTTKSPGPAAYGLKPVIGDTNAPSYSLTGRNAFGLLYDKKTPGPGTYNIVSPDVYKKRNPFYSMTGRNALPSDATLKPGPGSHSPEKVVVNRRSAPAFTFGMRHSEYSSPLISERPYDEEV